MHWGVKETTDRGFNRNKNTVRKRERDKEEGSLEGETKLFDCEVHDSFWRINGEF
jgi:hypothetical protein